MDRLINYCTKLYDKNTRLRLWLFIAVSNLGFAFVAIAIILNELTKAHEDDLGIVCWTLGVSGGVVIVASFVVLIITQQASATALKIARLDMAEARQDVIKGRDG